MARPHQPRRPASDAAGRRPGRRTNRMNLPPLPVLQAALRRITERLAYELAEPTLDAPDWSHFEWQLARAVAALHGASPLLATNLKWAGPPAWRSFLESQREHVANRHRRIAA